LSFVSVILIVHLHGAVSAPQDGWNRNGRSSVPLGVEDAVDGRLPLPGRLDRGVRVGGERHAVPGLEGFENVPGPHVLPFWVEQFRPVSRTLPPANRDTGVRSSIFRSPGFGWTMSSRTCTFRICSPGIAIGISRLWPVFAQHGMASAGEKYWS
jgi:hypothetical protein